MDTKELIQALNGLKVDRGSPACFGCGHKHNCGVHGCTVIRAAMKALKELEQVRRERGAAEEPTRADREGRSIS